MKKRIIALTMMIIFVFSVFQYGTFAASVVDGTPTTEKIYDTADATAEGSGYRLSLNNYWQVANYPDTAANIDANPFAPLSVSDLNAFKAQPTKAPAASPSPGVTDWKAVMVPSDLPTNADFKEASRVFYHAKIKVSQADADTKSFKFDFQGTSWIASVFVNGELVGTKKSTNLPWKLDVTSKIVAGDNDIYIGIKSPRYAIDSIGTSTMNGSLAIRKKLSDYFKPDFTWYQAAGTVPGAADSQFSNIAKLKWFASIYPSSKGGKEGHLTGICDDVSFVATNGKVTTEDVFVKTNVVDPTTFDITATSKKISADVTLFNGDDESKTVTVNMTASLKGGSVEKTFDPQTVTILPNSSKLVQVTDIDWASAKLWKPDLVKADAVMYNFNVTLVEGTDTLNTTSQLFGFRDIKIDGKNLRVNGIRRNFRHFGGTVNDSANGNEMIANMKSVNANYERYALVDLRKYLVNDAGKGNLNMGEQLDVFDAYGIPVTLCSMVDGMFASFNIVKNGVTNKTMFENFRETEQQMVMNYRNHPAVLMYSLENEFMFINAANIYSQYLSAIEKDVKTYMYDAVAALDPTRPSFTDGGCAGVANTLPIYAAHYHESTDVTTPSATLAAMGPSHGGWQYDNKRPYFAAEVMFFNTPLSYHNWVGGETAANNQKEALTAYAKYCSYMVDRYRWNDAAVISSVTSAQSMKGVNTSMQPLAMITKDYKTTFFASKGYTNDIKLINDTVNENPITFKWTLTVNGIDVQTKSTEYTIEPGFNTISTVTIAPITGITTRTKGTLKMEMIQAGSTSGLKTVELGIFPTTAKVKLTKKVYTYKASTALAASLKSLGVFATAIPKTMKIVASSKKVKYYVTIKHKKVAKYKIVKTYKTITLMSGTNLKYFIKDPKSILLVGANGLVSGPGEGDSRAIVLYARAGGRVITLEQNETNMLYSGLEGVDYWPKEIYTFTDAGNNLWTPSINFGQGFDKPILKGLQQSDLSFWNGGGNTANIAWQNVAGAKNWVYAGPQSKGTTLFELPVVNGMVTATQLKIGQRIAVEPVAQVLLANMLKNANAYTAPSATVAILNNEATNLQSMVTSTKVKYTKVSSIAAALNASKTKIFIVQASLANLNELNRLKSLYTVYTNAGGWVILWGLTPDGISAYNTLMGTQHIIRPFRREATASIGDGTSIGLSTADYQLYNSTIIAPWINLAEVSRDTFTYAIDATDEIAAFHDFEAEGYGNAWPAANNSDGNKASMVNNLYNGDFWHYIWQVWVGGVPSWDQRNTPGATPAPLNLYTFKLPKAEQITKVTFFNNKNYNAFKSATVSTLADDLNTVLEAKTDILPNSYDAVDYTFNNVLSKTINLKINSYYDNAGRVPMCGVDELQIYRKTPQWISDSKCVPLNSNGTIVKYPRGAGGVLLNNVKLSGFLSVEPASNLEFKAKIFSVFFQNLGAKFI